MNKHRLNTAVTLLFRGAFLLVLCSLISYVIPVLGQKGSTERSVETAPPGRNAEALTVFPRNGGKILTPDLPTLCDPGPWTAGTTGPSARYRHGGVSDGTFIYVFGGGDSVGNFLNDMWRWTPSTQTWTQLANMPSGKQNIQGAYWNGKIYVPGGFTTGSVHTTENAIYDIASNTWTTGAPLPTTQTGTNVAFNNKIYNFGGNPGPQSLCRVYDIATNTWSNIASLPVATTYGRAAVAGNFAYYAGGITTVTVSAVYRYSFAADSWATMAPLQTARTSEELVASPDSPPTKLFAVMGGDSTFFTGVPLAQSVEIYDIATNAWSYGNPVLTKAAAAAGGSAGGKVMVQGGVDNAVYLNNVQVSVVNPCQGTVIVGAGSTIQTEGCSPPNGVIDPGETVTISFCVQNTGNVGTTNLVGTLQATGGVTNPSGPQTYGALPPGGPAVCRSFTFTAGSTLQCGGTLTATIQFQDGATNLGNVTYNFSLGISSVTPPALPSGWTADQGTNAGGFPLWVTSNSGTPAPPADTLPNAAFSVDPSNLLDNRLKSPPLMYSAGSQLTFRQNYDLEMQNATTAFDAGVLEITNDGGTTWQDITTAGGTFVTGGYNHTFVSTGFMNPIAGARSSWSGISNSGAGGFETCTVNLPASLAGQTVQFRWRMCSDNSVSHAGWRVDTVRIMAMGGGVTFSQDFEGFVCCTSGAPQPSSAVSRKTHGAGGPTFDIALPLTPPVGIECRTGGTTNDYTMVVTFGSPVTVNGTPQAQVISGTGTIGTGGVSNGGVVTITGNNVTVPLTNVTNAQTIQVRLNNVTGTSGSGNVTIPMGVLIGDTNANAAVNSGDVSQTKARLGLALDATNFRSDVNANNAINAGDVSQIKSLLGTGLP